MGDPAVLNSSLSSLYTGWVGVLAVLKIQFAKVVTLGHAIGSRIYKTVARFEPALEKMVPEDYSKWVGPVLNWICKAIAITIAWWTQRILSAVHGAIRGG